ncbi:MAG: mechanosensitive ion channel [Armatimonadota bacterium]
MVEAFASYVRNVWQSTLPTRLVQAILAAGVLELLTWYVTRRIRQAMKRVLMRNRSADATKRVTRRRVLIAVPTLLVRAMFFSLGILIVLRILGFPTGAEIIPIGLAVVVAGLVACRGVLADAAAGYFILYDNVYGVGDRITVADVTGEVAEMSLRFTRLLTADGREICLRNSVIGEVTNHTDAVNENSEKM